MTIPKIAFVSLLVISAGSCWAAGESKIDLVYQRPVETNKPASQIPAAQEQAQIRARTGKCTVVVNLPNDSRLNKETLGTTFRDNPIISNQNPAAWLESALLDLKGQGFQTVSSKAQETSSAGNATIFADLDRLYVWNHGLNLHATVVLKAKFRNAAGETMEKKYRVNGTKLNWWNADSEFVDTLNLAAGRLLGQIAADLDTVCGIKTAAQTS